MLSNLDATEQRSFFERNPPVPLTPYTVTDVDAILEALQQVKQQGFAIVDQELEVGLLAIAVPIINNKGKAVAAMGISTQAQRRSREELINEFLPILKDGAQRITPLA